LYLIAASSESSSDKILPKYLNCFIILRGVSFTKEMCCEVHHTLEVGCICIVAQICENFYYVYLLLLHNSKDLYLFYLWIGTTSTACTAVSNSMKYWVKTKECNTIVITLQSFLHRLNALSNTQGMFIVHVSSLFPLLYYK
jgi:hypothetical protein